MAFNLFKAKSRLGVDIGTASIKVVELGSEAGRWQLLNYGMFELRGGAGQADAARTILDLTDQEIAGAIRDIVTNAGMKTRNAVATVASASTFATVIDMPYTTEEELAKAVPFEASKYVPVPLDQVVLDWSLVGVANEKPPEPVPGTNTTVEVFLAAVPKDMTARYQRIMKSAGLNLEALELENSALVRAVLGNDLSPTAILNIGGRSSSIIIVSKGYERLAHNYEIGGYEMTKAIAGSLNITPDQAESLKRKYGLIDSTENQARGAMLSVVDLLVFETRKTIESFEASRGTRISRLVLVGGLVNMPGLSQYVKQRIDRDVLVGNVFARLVFPPELTPLVQTLSNTLAIAVGAAMRPS